MINSNLATILLAIAIILVNITFAVHIYNDYQFKQKVIEQYIEQEKFNDEVLDILELMIYTRRPRPTPTPDLNL